MTLHDYLIDALV